VTLPDSNSRRLVVDVAALAECDVRTVEALARLALAARRQRHVLVLAGASRDLCELLALAGLTRVVPCDTERVNRRAAATRAAGRSARCRGRR
jgi:ABC-type transporter Mla MlaB component